jgi:hypothetical protein
MTQRLTENWLVDWSLGSVKGNTMPPRDPNDDNDDEDEDDDEDQHEEPAVIREPDEDE